METTSTEVKIRPGRPVIATSVRQQKLAEAQKLAAEGKTKPKGRPSNPESKRQQALNQKQTIIDAGGIIKPGRPALAKDTMLTPKSEVTADVVAG